MPVIGSTNRWASRAANSTYPPESFIFWSKHENVHRDRPTHRVLEKNTPNIFAPPGGRHLEIQHGRHSRPVFSYNSKTKTDRNILFVANPRFKGQEISWNQSDVAVMVSILDFMMADT